MKRMPSAEELRDLCQLDVFIETAVRTACSNARAGDTCHVVEVPETLSLDTVRDALVKEFPGCTIHKRWFTRFLVIKWT